MPSYDFFCRECGSLFEVQATFAEKSAGLNPECPACHARESHQIITSGVFLQAATRGSAGGCCGSDSGSGSGCCG